MQHCNKEFARESRRYLHQHPELSGQEYNTAKFIREKLREFGIEYQAVGETGTYGWIKGQQDNGRKILLRADIDALSIDEQTDLPYKSVNPGVMHACGHDVHTAALLAAAKKLAEIKDSFSGTVLLAFQQAEEFGHGSQYFRDQGLLKGYDRAFSEDSRQKLKEKIGELVDSVALSYGVQILCEYECFARALINDETARQEVAQVAAKLLGADKVEISESPIFGFAGDDFSEFLQESQGAYAHVGVYTEGSASARVLHSEKMAPAEAAVDIAADLHINYALSYLEQDD